jgi:hypothetical protein
MRVSLSTNQNKCDVELHGDLGDLCSGQTGVEELKPTPTDESSWGPRCARRVLDVAESDLTGGRRSVDVMQVQDGQMGLRGIKLRGKGTMGREVVIWNDGMRRRGGLME